MLSHVNSLRDRLLQAAGRVARVRPAVAARAAGFVRAAALPAGGFADRAGRADLYYTVFGLQTLAATEPTESRAVGLPTHRADAPIQDSPRGTRAYLGTFGTGADLDFVHLCCLIRCRALVEGGETPPIPPGRLETFRSRDGGYSHVPGAAHGTAYGAFLALGAWQDLGADPPEADRLADRLAGLRAADGGFAGTPGADAGAVPATAAAVVALAGLGRTVDRAAVDWLLRTRQPTGGWPAAPAVPTADLLSTATALHALSAAGAALDHGARAACLAFVQSLAAENGGFRGHPDEVTADCEYTFYGLLALGHLR